MLPSCKKILLSIVVSILVVHPIQGIGIETQSGFLGKVKGWFSKKEMEEAPVALPVKDSLSWKRYDYTSSCGFSIEFPGEPDHSGQIVEVPQSEITIRYDTYVTETASDNTVYVVSVWEYPEKVDISRPELNLQEGFSGMMQALPESQVLFMQARQIQGHKALEFWIVCEDVYFRGMLISVNHTLYQVFMVYKNKNPQALDKEYKAFSESFKITKIREPRTIPSAMKKKVSL
ncbi:hypothetical protein C10C_0205 [Chlamydia serpentis]|uniref:Uncharacterized protein n=1 Tax=Chlamydia serpentis TaxID=1967782 RepID=A0A2R8FAD0_9CHLA|nr:hypothetical protein [Chlamydia serpentis]SPN73383.1 hypothetical protein C10C_0205 [Chlamydia serpentis]